ncbi:hypothetical protein GOHSU_30_00270 [Gordonia hirsuta DSM 44140 = NBRC 16056]|uniref:p-aminobenzoate N-oxygenase AurF n=2 Tax=Gordonia hirsuta TaxID=53427 RepID=L7LDI8_9ACTN|nr:hypothetical protein GOHSU_30_00270 [Gordonia hirsuta DSM 44140 = NBRC 16056]
MEANRPPETQRPLSAEGSRVRFRRRITERQKTAQRLLLAAAEETYDGDLDVNWDAPLEEGRPWLPERLSTVYGTDVWESLSDEQRSDLGRRELVNVLSFSIYAESALTMLMFRDVAENTDLMDDFTRYTLKAIHEESRNSFMFTRLINKAELDVYTLSPLRARALSSLTPLIPAGATTAGVVLLAQEAVHSFARAIAADPTVQTHVRQVMRIHEIADARHLEFARLELAEALKRVGPIRRVLIGHFLAFAAARMYPMLLDSRVYTEVGLPEEAAMRAAKSGDAGVRTARAMTHAFVRFAGSRGLFRTPTEKLILRRAGVYARPVPDHPNQL